MKKTLRRSEENTKVITKRRIIGILVNVLLLASILLLLNSQIEVPTVEGSIITREEVEPGDYEDLLFETNISALADANIQLGGMTHGNIQLINEADPNYIGTLILDHEIGDIIYWELSDDNTEVYIDAFTGEIISYYNSFYETGPLPQPGAEALAEIVANQFNPLPVDRSSLSIDERTPRTTMTYDSGTYETTTVSYTYWIVQWERVIDGIPTADYITLRIDKNSNLHSYQKTWFMDLEAFDTTYDVPQGLAESIALAEAGPGSTIDATQKMVIRPNFMWTDEDVQFGLDPVCVWEIAVADADGNIRLYHIDGDTGDIIGGDFGPGWANE